MNNFKKFFFPFVFYLFYSHYIFSTHIVGGDFECNFLKVTPDGKFLYELKLILYRDCSEPKEEGPHPGFKDPISIGLFEKLTNLKSDSVVMYNQSIRKIFMAESCFSPDTICIEEGIYRTEITIPPNTNGFYFVWEHGWRNKFIKNIVNPLKTGLVFYCEIPNPSLQNSTPRFTNEPIKYMCAGKPFSYNFKVTDADGDSLVFKLDTPLAGTADSSNAYPEPSPVPHKTIIWNTGYSLNNIMSGNPVLTINQQTGEITVTPDSLGMFVMAVRVEEYRNGTLIGVNRRESQFMVVKCKPQNPPIISTEPEVNVIEINLDESFNFDVIGMDSLGVKEMVTLTAEGIGFDISKTNGFNFENKTAPAPVRSNFSVKVDCENVRSDPYPVLFRATNSGCPELMWDTLTVLIKMIDKGSELFPLKDINVFTPNDDGINDHFELLQYSLSICSTHEISYIIFNRWGQEIYRGDNKKSFSWDGAIFPAGVYFYIVEYNGSTKVGWIMMIR